MLVHWTPLSSPHRAAYQQAPKLLKIILRIPTKTSIHSIGLQYCQELCSKVTPNTCLAPTQSPLPQPTNPFLMYDSPFILTEVYPGSGYYAKQNKNELSTGNFVVCRVCAIRRRNSSIITRDHSRWRLRWWWGCQCKSRHRQTLQRFDGHSQSEAKFSKGQLLHLSEYPNYPFSAPISSQVKSKRFPTLARRV